MRIAIVSGYFNPTHIGHLRMMQHARSLADSLLVIVNNDLQQVLKKGRVILDQDSRLELVQELRIVDEAFVALDQDATVRWSLRSARGMYPDADLVFCNGGDRNSDAEIPEAAVCREHGIELRFGVGGAFKTDSSTRLIEAMQS